MRVSRALEVFELTGKPLSEWHAAHAFAEVRHHARLVGVNRPRDELDRRIEASAGRLDAGWVDEVAALRRDFAGARALGSVGYKQVSEHLDGALPPRRAR